ncbi:MAG: hypothetical protein ACTSPI_16780 [Candidatus Heimdallarchaeaceae archaeon]
MEQEIITLTKVFEDLNRISNNSLFYFDGERVIPSNNRIKLIFFDSLFIEEGKFSFSYLSKVLKEELARSIEKNFEGFPKSFVFIYNPTYYQGGKVKHSTDNAIVEFSKKFAEDTKICIQQDDREFPPRRSFLISTEELGELICMLYFREKGYIVQSPLGTYGREGDNKPGVDDVVAWESPVIDKLKRFGFINKGCHISELACLRWLGKVPTSNRDSVSHITKEMILTEVEPSIGRGISNSPSTGINQLLRAKKEKIAKKLFICFPFVNKNVEEIFAKIKSRTKEGPTIGGILFNNKGLYVNDSETFPDESMHSAIDVYEKNLKRVLLNNFYFDEILEMIKELNIDTKNKGFEEVMQEFYKKIEEVPADYVLEKLDDLTNNTGINEA